ncbi:MAG: ribosome recycling factor [Parabacteroides sp.]
MRNSIKILLDEVQKRMSGYAALMCYQLANICVKADPMALMEVKLETSSGDLNLEEVAQVALPNEFQFIVIPNEEEQLINIGKAILQVHPEFKLEEKEGIDDLIENEEEDETEQDNEDQIRVIVCTMPEINKERRDACMEATRLITEETDSKLQTNFVLYTERITKKLVGAKAEELDEAKEALEDIYNQHKDICKQYRENKEKDIEEAYQKYLNNQQEQQQQAEEEEAAAGSNTIRSMVMGGDE